MQTEDPQRKESHLFMDVNDLVAVFNRQANPDRVQQFANLHTAQCQRRSIQRFITMWFPRNGVT